MAKVLLLTNTLGASAEVLPALGLLQHQVKILPAEASVLVDAPDVDLVLIDARRDLPAVKSLTKLLDSTGVGCPIIAITTEGGLTAFNADWGIDDVILDTAGPAEVDARIRIALGKHAIELVAADPHSAEIRSGDVTIDEATYTARLKGNVLDLTFKEFELSKVFSSTPRSRIHTCTTITRNLGL
jgi:DNA-binding response OmpR family regulator